MDAKIPFAVLGVVTMVFFFSENAEGKNMLLFNKPFFSTDVKNSNTFKDQLIVTGSECPSAYSKFFNGSRYKFVDSCQGVSQSDAQSDCKRDCSHLVFVETKEENDFLVREASRDTKYWIGLFSPKRPLFWDNGNQVTFVNLDRENQDTFNDGTGCFKMSNTDERYWLDKSCKEELGFICECECEDSRCLFNATECLYNSCYKFINDSPASHLNAQSKCKNNSCHLVFIESKEENDFLVERAQNDTEYWIGLHDRPQLFWDNGKEATSTNINSEIQFSFNHRASCYGMKIVGGKKLWCDRRCTEKHSYVCEYDKGKKCSNGDKSFNDSCYKFVDSGPEVSWVVAQSDCKNNSAHLVYIETKAENDFFINETSDDKEYWIGLFSPKRHLFWDNGNQVTFVNLDHRKKKGTFDDDTGCFKMSNRDGRYWLDKSCGDKLGFICECEDSGCLYDTMSCFNNSCYTFVNETKVSRISAELQCNNNSSHLVYIESKEENDFLVGRAQKDIEYWIGLHDRQQLFWGNGNQVTYANIDANVDDTFNDRPGCFKMSNHGGRHVWLDQRCDDMSGYICEYEG